ncbi:MAG: glycoside hydrolase family 99-like domain-containing protein [Lachnospiraceae bacterium]|nr:glycoside hydrolase family 99-like domain-containing protein [Lachnospiraceae bacterium]
MGSSPSRFRENLGRLQDIVDGRGSNGTNMTQSGTVPIKNETAVNITQDKQMLTEPANEVDITIENLDINQQNNIAHEDGEVDIKELIIINAMNEWGEGAMLEPDEAEGYGYLEAVAEVIGC